MDPGNLQSSLHDRALPDPEYVIGLDVIVTRLKKDFETAFRHALGEHRNLVSSVLARRLLAPLVSQAPVTTEGSATVPRNAAAPFAGQGSSQRTTRVLVLDVIATSAEPMSFFDVKRAVVAAGGSELSAHKMRTDLIKRGCILNRRGLYSITDAGREMRAAYG